MRKVSPSKSLSSKVRQQVRRLSGVSDGFPDTATDFSWEPKGERFAIVSSGDPNLGNPGPGITIKTDVSFYQLERGKNDFRLLSECNPSLTSASSL